MNRSLHRIARAAVAGALVAGMVGVASAQDPLEVGPNIYSKKFENERVRVMEASFKAGDSIAMHSHPDHFAYVLAPGTLRLTYPDGQSKDIAANVGEVFWIPAESHATENIGDSDVRILVVELK